MTDQLRQRPGDQPLPTPTNGPSMHDLVIADLRLGEYDPTGEDRLADFLVERRDLGLRRYGSLLQAHNGRDALRDLLEEVADAIVYARQAQVEGRLPQHGPELALRSVARSILRAVDAEAGR